MSLQSGSDHKVVASYSSHEHINVFGLVFNMYVRQSLLKIRTCILVRMAACAWPIAMNARPRLPPLSGFQGIYVPDHPMAIVQSRARCSYK